MFKTGWLGGFVPPPPLPLLGTTGTELLQFALLVAAGVWFCRREGKDAGRFVAVALFAVSFFYLLCPETSPFQQHAGDALMSGMAGLQAGLMNLGGADVRADGPAVVGMIRFTYIRGCMGLSYLAMGLLVVLAYPAPWRRQLGAALVLGAGMVLLNALRLVVLYQLWENGQTVAYDAFHRVGGAVFALGAAGLFAAALAARPAGAPAPAPAPAPEGA
jgi:exosortase/archaeosortase family protein